MRRLLCMVGLAGAIGTTLVGCGADSPLQQLEPSIGASHPATRQARALAEGTPVAPR